MVSRRGRIEVEEEGDGVEEREGQNREQGSAGNPLQLLAEQRGVGLAVAAQEEQRGQDVKSGVVGGRGLVEAMLEQPGGQARLDGPDPEREQSRARRVDQRQQPAAAKALEPLLGEAEGEVQEERRLQRLGQRCWPRRRSSRAPSSCPVYLRAYQANETRQKR